MPDLPLEARQVLADLELISHGGTTAYNSSGRGKPESRAPKPLGEEPPHIKWRRLMEAHPDRTPSLIAQAREELEALRRGNRRKVRIVPEAPIDRTRRMLRDGEGFTVAEVAASFRCTMREVREVRERAQNPERDVAFGRPLAPPREWSSVEIVELRRRGVSPSEIARLTGKAVQSVSRTLRRAA